MIHCLAATLWLAGAFGSNARADAVYLKNGRKLYGIVVSETGSNVAIDVGPGVTTIPRSIVRRIVRSSAEERQKMKQGFELEYFDSGRWVPKDSVPIFKLYEEVVRAHLQAEQAEDVQAQVKKSRDEIEERLDDYRGVGRAMAVQRVGRLQAISEAAERDVDAYATSYWRLRRLLSELPATASKTAQEFRVRLEAKLKPIDGEFQEDTVALEVQGGRRTVRASLDDKIDAVFAVDLAAPVSVITPRLLAQLHPLPYKGNGSAMQIGSIAIGRLRAERVGVEVGNPPGVEGVLGMSFWGHFYVEDGGDKLILRRLASADEAAAPLRGGLPAPPEAWSSADTGDRPSWNDNSPHGDWTRYPLNRTTCQDPDGEYQDLLDSRSDDENPRKRIRSAKCSDIVAWEKSEKQRQVHECLDRGDVYGSIYRVAGAFYWDGRCGHAPGLDRFVVDFRSCDRILANPICPDSRGSGQGGGAGGAGVALIVGDAQSNCFECEFGCGMNGQCNSPPKPQTADSKPGRRCHCPWGCDPNGDCRPQPPPPPDPKNLPPQELPGDVKQIDISVDKAGMPIHLQPGCAAGQASEGGSCAPIELKPKDDNR